MAAMKWPMFSCLISSHWRDTGALVQVIVTRSRDSDEPGPMCVGDFLVDLGCLGLKNGHGGFMLHADRQFIAGPDDRTGPAHRGQRRSGGEAGV